jgi:acetate kinase
MVAVVNVGSSSVKCSFFTQERLLFHSIEEEVRSYDEALQNIFKDVDVGSLEFVVHRVVHGGEFFTKPCIVNEAVLEKLKSISFLAPLHNPNNILGIEFFLNNYPHLKQIAVFDTAFHTSLPQEAYMYAIDTTLAKKYHIRRYGFHGFSHAYLLHSASKLLEKQVQKTSLITIHLGNGASICAIEDGKSVETSMGMTPLEGLVMGSRSGDIDPGVLLYLQKEVGMSVDALQKLLNKQSGLQGLCSTNDMRKITAQNTQEAKVVLGIYVRRIVKYVGAYIALLEKVDGIVFSGGVGEHSFLVRQKVLESLEKFGILTDYEANEQNCVTISKKESSVAVFVIPTNEELEMLRSAREVVEC